MMKMCIRDSLKELGWCVKGSKQSPEDAQKLHQLGIETYPFALSDEMKRLPDHIRPLFNCLLYTSFVRS